MDIGEATVADLLLELSLRGGHPGALGEAGMLCLKKSEDYNRGMGHADPVAVNRDAYFPFGLTSYTQMLHTKTQRLVSLCQADATNFESARDTCLDLINYAGFCADWLQRSTK